MSWLGDEGGGRVRRRGRKGCKRCGGLGVLDRVGGGEEDEGNVGIWGGEMRRGERGEELKMGGVWGW